MKNIRIKELIRATRAVPTSNTFADYNLFLLIFTFNVWMLFVQNFCFFYCVFENLYNPIWTNMNFFQHVVTTTDSSLRRANLSWSIK